MTVTLVVPESLQSAAVMRATRHVVAAPTRTSRWTWMPGHRRRDRCVEFLADQEDEVVVLAPADEAGLRRAARQLGIAVVTLSTDGAAAAWSVAIVGHIERSDRSSMLRVVDVVAPGPDALGLPRGDHAVTSSHSLTNLRPATIVRLASRLWCACTHCAHGGRAAGMCAGCGLQVASGVPE